jgi:nucleoside-diphosphate-sugar epimerase
VKHKALVVGGLGVVGRATLDHMTSMPDWDVVALSRRAPDFPTRAQFVSVDLSDRAGCRQALSPFNDVTHVVYAALQEQASVVSGWTDAEHVRTNLQMLTNLLDAIEEASPALRHITLMQGAKAYGIHLGAKGRIPFKESDPRPVAPNFYFDQEDLIRARQKTARWTWTVLRPPGVCGVTIGSPMNTLVAVGVYAAVCRELGLPFEYPGGEGSVKEVCDARLLAKSVVWAGTTPACGNEIFNIANGDCFMWEHLWPRFAEVFGMECAPPRPQSVAQAMPDKGPAWDRIVAKHGLRPHRFEQLVPSWDFMDFTFRHGRPSTVSLMSTVKARQAGFQETVDTEAMFVELLRQLQDDKILPA